MEEKVFHTLELDKILLRLSERAAFSASKDLALSLKPVTDLAVAQHLQQETTEACLLLSLKSELSIGGAHDIRKAAQAAARGIVLEPIQLLDVKSTLVAARTLRRSMEETSPQTPHLAGYAARMEPVPGLVDGISHTLDDRGLVLDSASDKLASIRKEMHIVQERLNSKLQKMVGDARIIPLLQEPIITQRDGRSVLPLRAEFKGRLKAVIHDQSSSGATLFVEPLSIVNFNNQVRELNLDERNEVRRILAELSSNVGEAADQLDEIVAALALLDLAFAKARYAEELRAAEPILKPWGEWSEGHPGSSFRLGLARHPLLDPEMVVPVDLLFDPETYALVITGPNTGGKTVALKTAGLLTLMAQCGLHIPAQSGSELSVFESVFADIGDEQSIEQSLSTFSAHISNIVEILEKAGPRSLVILDELGAGTDPQEGAALAKALLDEFLARACVTLVATHYPELKSYAHVTPGVRNASVEFDMESLKPTYHLTIGLPGRSNALAIAERLGLASEIAARAREMVSPQELQADGLLDEIHRQLDLSREDRAAAEVIRLEQEKMHAEIATRLEAIEDERHTILLRAKEDGTKEFDALRSEIESLRKKLKSAAQPLEIIDDLVEEMQALEDLSDAPVERRVTSEKSARRSFKLGDKVWIRTLEAGGVITSLRAGEAEVQIGRLRVKTKFADLQPPGDQPVESAGKRKKRTRIEASASQGEIRVSGAPPLELDLRGTIVEDALEELDRRLDGAYLSGMPFVRIIHGKGTGRLREAIRATLKTNPYVASFKSGHASEGGEGVTVIHLAVN
jgi:DNA mismatch repair protein MutS2